MSLINMDLYSEALRMETHVTVVLPEEKQGIGIVPQIRKDRHPVVLLLHGTSGNSTDWERWTSVERYAGKKGVALVMPSAQLSGYADMTYGERFFEYISTEVLEKLRRILPLSEKREDTFVAGLSMGGYGALKVGLTYPERFAAIGAISNGNHAYIAEMIRNMAQNSSSMVNILSDRLHLCWGIDMNGSIVGSRHDVFALAQKAIDEGKPLPPIFSACGTDDHNYPAARQMYDFFTSLPGDPFRYSFHQEAGGHTWEFWDKWIPLFLDWIPLHL